MSNSTQVFLDFQANIEQANKNIEELTAKMNKSLDEIKEHGDDTGEANEGASNKALVAWVAAAAAIAVAWKAVSAAVDIAFDQMAEATEEAGKTALNMIQMNSTLEMLTPNAKKFSDQFVETANSLELLTDSSADQVIELQNLAVQYGRAPALVDKMTKAALGLKAIGVDATTAIRGMSQTLAGQPGTLARVIPAIRELTAEQLKAGDAINLIASQYGPLLGKELQVLGPNITRLGNIWMSRWLQPLSNTVIQNKHVVAGMNELGTQLELLAPDVSGLGDDVSKVAFHLANFTEQALLAGSTVTKAFAYITDAIAFVLKMATMLGTALTAPIQLMLNSMLALSSAVGASDGTIAALEGAKLAVDLFAGGAELAAKGVAASAHIISDGMDEAADAVHMAKLAMQEAADAGGDLGDRTSKGIGKIAESAKKEVDKLKEVFIEGWDKIGEAIGQQVSEEMNGIVLEGFDQLGADIGDKVGSVADIDFIDEGQSKDQAGGLMGGLLGTDSMANALNVSDSGRGIFDAGMGVLGDMGSQAMDMIMWIVEALKDPEAIKEMTKGLVETTKTILESIANPETLKVIVDAAVALVSSVVDLLADPEFLEFIVHAAVELVIQVISVIVPKIPVILWNAIKAIGKELWLRIKQGFNWLYDQVKKFFNKIWEAIKAPFKAIGKGFKSLFGLHAGGTVLAHSGLGLPGGNRNEVIARLQNGEAVVPNAPGSYQGLQTDGNGNIRGGSGGSVINNYYISATDAQSFFDMLKRGGMTAFNDMLQRNLPDSKGRYTKALVGS